MPEHNLVTAAAALDTPCVPVRYWWLKRIALASSVLLAVTVGVHFWWLGFADGQFARVLVEVQASGEPLRPQDFNAAPIPDEENAAILYVAAAHRIHEDPTFNSLATRRGSFARIAPEKLDESIATLEAHRELLELLRRARLRPRTAWPLEFTSPLIKVQQPNLADLRVCARLLALNAAVASALGESREVVDSIADIFGLSDAVAAGATIIDHNFAVAIAGVGVETLEAALPEVSFRASGNLLEADGMLGDAMAELLSRMRNEEPFRRGFERAVCMERAVQLDTMQLLVGSDAHRAELLGAGVPNDPVYGRLLLGPMFKTTAVHMTRYMAFQVDASRAANWPQHLDRLAHAPSLPAGSSGFDRPTALLRSILLPELTRFCQLHYRALANRRLATAALALRMFALEQGVAVDSLEVLVAAGYLPDVPADPFTRELPLRYVLTHPQPVLYSIGLNGVDEGGAFVLSPRGRGSRDSGDLVFFLDGPRPRYPAR